MSFINIVALHIVLNLIIYYSFGPLKKFINVYDFPDNKRKLHSEPIPLIGGFVFLINIIFFLSLEFSSISKVELNIIICSSFFLFVGILDDKFNLGPYTKFLFLIIALFIFFNFTENTIITHLKVYGYTLYLGNGLDIFFSILCVMLFVNAFNLFDGINLQSSSYGLFFLLFLIYKTFFFKIAIVLLIPLLLIIYLNNKNKIFMGDSGTLFLGSIISLIVIVNYTKFNLLEVDEIFLLMFLPGIDMLRLFIQRVVSKKNPFIGDREHLHHYFLTIYSYKKTILFIILLSIIPSILNIYLDSKFVIIIFLTMYLFLIFFFKKKLKKKN